MELQKEIDMFRQYLKDVKGRPETTITAYVADVRQYVDIMKGFDNIDCIKVSDVNNIYIKNLVSMGMSATTRSRKISALKTFYKFLAISGNIDKNIFLDIEMPKIPKKVIKVMSNDEVHNVLSCANGDSKKADGDIDWFRNITLLKLMLNTAIRREEVVNIRLKDININENSILIHGKGDKERIVYYNNDVKALLSEYIYSHRNIFKTAKDSEFLFVTTKAGKMCVSTVNKIYNKYRDMAGLKEQGYTVHSLRKTAATNMYQQTGDIYAVKGILGHSSIATTELYARLGEENKKKAAMAISL